MVLESLIPALKAQSAGERLPEHVRELEAEGIHRANLIDATPIGANVRSTVATYADIHDELRRAFARCDAAKTGGWKAGDFSYNTGRLRCPTCDGTGSISLDVQFLPDVTIECPDCGGSRYASEAGAIRRAVKGESHLSLSLPQLMAMSVDQALAVTHDLKKVHARLTTLHDLGLGYLTLGEPTPALSGGEAQRLKLASEMGKAQSDAVFVFDEPTIGLHPLDVRVLLGVFDRLVASGATVVVIMTVMQALGFFFGNGAGNSMSRELGKQNNERASRLLAVGFAGAVISGLVIAAIGLLILRPLVVMLGSTSTIAPYAVQYLTPLLVAAPCVCGSFALNGLLRYQGQSAFGMIGLVSGALLNFLLAPLFIFVAGLGIFGAGLATAICQTVSFAILTTMSRKFGVMKLSLRNCKPDVLLMREVAGGGLPSLIRQGAGSISVTCVNIAANPFGDAAIAGMAIVMRIMLGANSVIVGLGQGFQPVCGYNYGAGLFARVKEGYWFCVRLATCVLVALAVLLWVFAPQLVEIFRSDPAVVAVGVAALHIQCCTVILNGFNMMGNMMTQTMGRTGIASFLALCRQGLFLAPVVLILPMMFGVLGVEMAQSVSDVLTFLVTIPFMRRILHELR